MAAPTTAQQAFFKHLCDQWGGTDNFLGLPSTVAFKRTMDTESVGWRTHLPTDFLGIDRTLDIVVTGRFPEEIPQLWVEPNPFLEWPHAESDGKLCLWLPGQAPVWLSQTEIADEMIHLLRRLIKMVQSGTDSKLREVEFASEWMSYWMTARKPNVQAPGVVLLLDPPADRPAVYFARILSAAWPGDVGKSSRSRILVVAGQTSADVDRWVGYSRLQSTSQDSTIVLIVPLHSAPTAPGAPKSLAEAESFIEHWAADQQAASNALGSMLSDTSSMSRWLVFSHGDSALAGLRFAPRKAASRSSGRQNAKTRKHDEANRRRIGFEVNVAAVQRADAAWLQERAMNALTRPLISSRVAVIGCGSLGSMVSENLALAGIGNLTLIDPGGLETANIGRHALGMAAVGSAKVTALRVRLLSDYPHITVTEFDKRVQVDDTALRDNIEAADLVVCTTADPECERYLMTQLKEHRILSLMIAWSEPHALGGHSVHTPGDPYVLESLFADGRCVEPATVFPQSPTIPLPGCGESHIPGAGNRIRLIASNVVEHALDLLLDTGGVGEHRTWVASSKTIEAHGGTRLLLPEFGAATTVVRVVPMTAAPNDTTVAV